MKQLIAITLPTFFPGEAQVITTLFQNGLERLHLRKPAASADELRRLLDEIPGEYHPAIALHDHFELWKEYPAIGGVHLNSRNAEIPPGFRGRISRSCHTFEEVVANRHLSYCFLSPIFESISKEGYGSGFPMERLHKQGLSHPKSSPSAASAWRRYPGSPVCPSEELPSSARYGGNIRKTIRTLSND